MAKEPKSKALILGCIFFLFTLGSGFATAGTEQNQPAAIQIHSLEVITEVSATSYKEPGLMEENGAMIGIGGSYTYRENVMLQVEGIFKYGQVDYDGSTQSGTPVQASGIDNYLFEVRMTGGYDFLVSTTTITPYIGLGHRYLVDNADTIENGYKRESNYLYSPLGVTTNTALNNGWFFGVTVEYDIFWNGVQKSYLSDIDSRIGDVENDQHEGYGFRASIVFHNSTFSIEPFFRYWSIEDSDAAFITVHGSPVAIGIEPNNNSTEVGLKAAYIF